LIVLKTSVFVAFGLFKVETAIHEGAGPVKRDDEGLSFLSAGASS
jgi:hypothetical protein